MPSNADLLAIKAELTNDPKSLGLTLSASDDEANANKLNAVSSATPIDRESIPVSDVVKAIDADEFIALSVGQRDYLKMVTAAGSVNPKGGGEVREAIMQFFGAASETRASLTLLLTESASRISQMYKSGLLTTGSAVTPSDIANARNAT
tara:strand:- start:128 stop:577 length:450 start_codon:yes stop_codon:yes gene_type:complete